MEDDRQRRKQLEAYLDRGRGECWLKEGRIAELVARYRDLPLGTVDASVVATAERLNVTDIATLDRRHFTIVQPSTASPFTLLPSGSGQFV